MTLTIREGAHFTASATCRPFSKHYPISAVIDFVSEAAWPWTWPVVWQEAQWKALKDLPEFDPKYRDRASTRRQAEAYDSLLAGRLVKVTIPGAASFFDCRPSAYSRGSGVNSDQVHDLSLSFYAVTTTMLVLNDLRAAGITGSVAVLLGEYAKRMDRHESREDLHVVLREIFINLEATVTAAGSLSAVVTRSEGSRGDLGHIA